MNVWRMEQAGGHGRESKVNALNSMRLDASGVKQYR